MEEKKKPNFHFEVANIDDPVHVTCPFCQQRSLTTAKILLKGLHQNCSGCGALMETRPQSTTPHVVQRQIRGQGETLDSKIVVREDGLWLYQDESEREMIGTLDFDSDRAVALVFGSMVENRLERVVRARSQRDKEIELRVFQPSGSLGSFSAKIDLAFLMGLISPEAHADLVSFKDVRNLFAHKTNVRDFGTQQIKDKCANFKLIDTRVEDVTSDQLVEVINSPNPTPIIRVKFATKRKRQAKDRYLLTAQIFNLQLVLGELKGFPLPLI